MEVILTNLQDVKIIKTKVFGDHRGFFSESYTKNKFYENGILNNFIQDNHSFSSEPGTLRGLHYQTKPKAQAKLVRCTKGVIYDVLVDLRKGSPSFKKWEAYILSEFNHHQLLVPKGFAHGFCTLTRDVNVEYKVDEVYSKIDDFGIAYDDPELDIFWPMDNLVLSYKDKSHPKLSEVKNNFIWGEV